MDAQSLNLVVLVGWVGKVTELKHAAGSNTKFCRLSLATNEYFKGDEKTRVEWHNLTAFGFRAEFIAKNVKKGDPIIVIGKLRSRYWAQDGETRKFTEVHVENIIFLKGVRTKKEDEEEEDQEAEVPEEEDQEEPENLKGEDPF